MIVFQIDFLDLVDMDNKKLKQKISDSETKIQVRRNTTNTLSEAVINFFDVI